MSWTKSDPLISLVLSFSLSCCKISEILLVQINFTSYHHVFYITYIVVTYYIWPMCSVLGFLPNFTCIYRLGGGRKHVQFDVCIKWNKCFFRNQKWQRFFPCSPTLLHFHKSRTTTKEEEKSSWPPRSFI